MQNTFTGDIEDSRKELAKLQRNFNNNIEDAFLRITDVLDKAESVRAIIITEKEKIRQLIEQMVDVRSKIEACEAEIVELKTRSTEPVTEVG